MNEITLTIIMCFFLLYFLPFIIFFNKFKRIENILNVVLENIGKDVTYRIEAIGAGGGGGVEPIKYGIIAGGSGGGGSPFKHRQTAGGSPRGAMWELAPYGFKKDGTPKKRPGKKMNVQK